MVISTRWKTILAFAFLYFGWGGAYLAARIALNSLPPFFMGGVSFLTAGVTLYLISAGAVRPTARQWGSALLLGALMIAAGNGVIAWAELRVASGLAAVIVSTEPVWMTLWESWESRRRPPAAVIAGLLLGVAGIVLLARPGPSRVDPVGFWVLLGATFAWIVGSLISRRAPLHATPARGAGMYMITGGLILLLVSALLGEFAHLRLAAVTPAAWCCWLYLAFVCSVGGMTAYLWLMQHAPISRVATYAFVNPALALFLGAAFGHEQLTTRALLAAALMVAGVALIVTRCNLKAMAGL